MPFHTGFASFETYRALTELLLSLSPGCYKDTCFVQLEKWSAVELQVCCDLSGLLCHQARVATSVISICLLQLVPDKMIGV
jgi:hypothetical protein